MSNTERKPILCLDFDGVIHSYTSGWKGIDVIQDPPVDGAIEFLWKAIEHFKVCIFSSRSASLDGINAMRQWLGHWDKLYWKEHPGVPQPRTGLVFVVQFPTTKPSAFVTLDDRAITFNGNWPSIEELKNFTPWFVRPSEQALASGAGEDDRLTEVCRALVDYRKRAGPLNFQLEKADDYLREIELILEGEHFSP